jgi:hypothetical protein
MVLPPGMRFPLFRFSGLPRSGSRRRSPPSGRIRVGYLLLLVNRHERRPVPTRTAYARVGCQGLSECPKLETSTCALPQNTGKNHKRMSHDSPALSGAARAPTASQETIKLISWTKQLLWEGPSIALRAFNRNLTLRQRHRVDEPCRLPRARTIYAADRGIRCRARM